MKVRLDILASTSIKRRKPWSQVVWLGKERESLFLLDEKRVSVLYVPSGKTKRTVPKISSLLSDTVYLTANEPGTHLVGLQSSGEVFLWHKDGDELKTVCGLASLLQEGDITVSDGCAVVFPSPDCSRLVVIAGNKNIFVWQRERSATDAKNNTLLGRWSIVKPPETIWIASTENKSVSSHAVFTNKEILGDSCQLSIVFNHKTNLNVVSLFLRFNGSSNSPENVFNVSAEWTCLQYPIKNIHPGCEAMAMKGAYLGRYTHDGQVLAVAVNQKSPLLTNVLYVSVLTETVLVSDLRGCGLREPDKKRGKQYWIGDMSWTSDNLFLAVILRNGCAGLLSRLGEPLVLFSKGCSVDMGPSYFLPFSPLISIQSDRSKSERSDFNPSINSELDPLRQMFSVSTHSSLPIVLFSDGYMVTIAQLPSEFSPMIFMRDLVLESSSHLKQVAESQRLDLTLANAYNLPAGDLEGVKTSPSGNKNISHTTRVNTQSQYTFEEAAVSLNDTIDSEVSFALGDESMSTARPGAVHHANSGKVIFGEADNLLVTEGSFLNEPNSTMKALQLARHNLFNVWKLAASTSELWSANFDKIISHTVHNIVKLFSLILDCPQIKDLLDEALGGTNKPSPVQTASLFKVISMYRQLLDLLQFDCQQRHLLAAVIQLCHKSLMTVLGSVGLVNSDPRLKTLTGCFTLLKFTEKSLQTTYVGLPRSLLNKGLTPRFTVGEGDYKMQIGGGEGLHDDAQLAKRLTATWTLLYKAVGQFLSRSDAETSDLRQGQALLSAIQQCLVELDANVPHTNTQRVAQGDKLSLDGKHTLAMNAWKNQLQKYQEKGSSKNAARLFHSLLYTYILRNDLTSAVSFIDNLIVKASFDIDSDLDPESEAHRANLQPSLMTFVSNTLKTQAFQEPDMVPCIRDRAIRQVVQSISRFMAAYFSNQTLFIFPPHNPTPLPAVHFETSIINSRIIPKYHEDLAAIIRHQKLGSIWTVERTLEYLLLSGLVCEAAWFADRMGDWKAAYQLSVSHTLHRKLAAPLYVGQKKPLSLPDWLTPDSIMKRKLDRLIKDDIDLNGSSSDLTHLTGVVEDISLAGVMGFVEIGAWLMQALVTRLKAVVKQFPPLVTKDFYLPAPPCYCPQLSKTDTLRYSLEAEEESKLREKASSIIQLVICVMNATHLSIPVVTWYVQALGAIQKKATQFKATTEPPCMDLPDMLYQYLQMDSDFFDAPDDASVNSVQSCFRDLCSLVWLLHARDKLSMSLRSREKFLNLGLDVDNGEQWLRECFSTLQWAVHLIAFSRFLSDESNIYKVLLSLLLELPSTEDTADILAEHLYDVENLHPEVQERLERMLASWQGVILVPEADGKSVGDSLDMDEEGRKSVTFLGASPRGKSLSVYFHKQCITIEKVLKKKAKCFGSFEEYVFADNKQEEQSSSKVHIGSRPFETKISYVEFLDTFVSVSFSKVRDVMAGKDRTAALPFLRGFAKEIVDREMTYFVDRVRKTRLGPHGLSVLSGASQQALARANSQERGGPASGAGSHSRDTNVPGRTSGRVNRPLDTAVAQAASKNRPVGLFRGYSMFDVPPERSHATVRRYESESGLNAVDDFSDLSQFEGQSQGQSQQGPSTSHHHNKNMTGMASRFAQSEESLYTAHHGGGGPAGAEQDNRSSWSLVVNFGKKYTALQQLVEWLEVWGKKSHSLGIGAHEEILDIAPKMKIQIPAQLIILSLWLLENKYRHNQRDERRVRGSSVGRRGRRLSRSPARKQTPSPPNRQMMRGHRSQTPPRYPEEKFLYSHPGRRSVTPPTPQAVGSRHSSPADKSDSHVQEAMKQSLVVSSLEQNQIIDAYTQVLDGPEDSSSIGVSSLASDELEGDLKNTLNALRGNSPTTKENSALNKVIYHKDESPERGHQRGPVPKETSTPLKEPRASAKARTPSLSPPPPSLGKDHPHPKPASQQPALQGNGGDIANQLQGIIRDELRRIMEVQHRSVLAMIGALDDGSPPSLPPAPTHHQQQPVRPHPSPQPVSEEVFYAENETPSLSSPMPRSRKGSREKEVHVRTALSELQNLQTGTSHSHRNDQRPGKMPLLYMPQEASRIPNYQSPEHSNTDDFHLPHLPRSAWTDDPHHQHHHPSHSTAIAPPLLHIQHSPHQPFSNFRQFLSRLPPPSHPSPRSFSHHTTPSQQGFLHLSENLPPPNTFFTSAPQRPPPPPYENRSLPLLGQGLDHTSGFPLLQLLPGGAADRDEVARKREELMKGFHDKVFQDRQKAEREIAPHQLLQFQRPASDLDRDRVEMKSESVQYESQKSSPIHHPSPQHKQQVVGDQEEEEEALEGTQEGVTSIRSTQEASEAEAAARQASAQERSVPISDGFALPRGVFDSYLKLGEQLVGPEVSATNAAFQMKMAQAMQKQLEKEIRRKVDFSTMTQEQVESSMLTDPAMEVIRTAEAATSITKDTGVDPIQEAVNEYNLKRHNNLIPPDIFMGLRFNEQDVQTGVAAPSDDTQRRGRAYLNVVDIRASSVLKDIPERAERPELVDKDEMMDSALITSEQTSRQMAALESTLRDKLGCRQQEPQRPLGQDAVTVRVFDQLKAGGRADSVSVAVLPRSSSSQPKSAMIRRLRDMSDQIKAIDEMSQNIERDFKSSHLLLNTIQDVNESISVSRSASPSHHRRHGSPKRQKELRYSYEDEEFEDDGRYSPETPYAPKASAKSPQVSARSKSSAGTLSMSGSAISELIGEVLAEEGVDLQSAGFSQEVAAILEKDAQEHIEERKVKQKSTTPRDKLMDMKKAEEQRARRTAEEREQLKLWMTEKFYQRHEEYKKRRSDLIEREPRPFKSQSVTTKINLKTLDEERNEKRKHMASEFMHQRLLEAEHLMGSIIVDKPQLSSRPDDHSRPREASKSPQRSRSRSVKKSPGRGGQVSPGRAPSVSSHAKTVTTASRSPRSRTTKTTHDVNVRQASPEPRTQDTAHIKGILKTTTSRDSHHHVQPQPSDYRLDGDRGPAAMDPHILSSITEGSLSGADSSLDLIRYARAVLDMDQSGPIPSQSFESQTQSRPKPSGVTKATKTKPSKVKEKSMADVVRLQRPEVTRKWKEMNAQRKQEEDEIRRRVEQDEINKSASEGYQKEKQKIYGSKQMPGSSPRNQVTIPRRVKTYSERLQEMKPSQKFSPRVSRGPSSARSMSTGTVRTGITTGTARSRGPPHQPQTYVQQLQRLSAKGGGGGATATKRGMKTVPVQGRTFLRSHGPTHKPKTYTEQLQSLNPHPQHKAGAVRKTHTHYDTVSMGPSSMRHQARRARPYGDPYAEVDYADLESVLSDWDMADDVRNIIYGGSTASNSVAFLVDDVDMSLSGGGAGDHVAARHYAAPSEGQSDYFEAIMRGDEGLYSRVSGDVDLANDYRSSVDIREIERIADEVSVGAGSVASVIDWDEIDDLIKDV